MESPGGRERRRYTRLYEPFPVWVRAMDARGEAFESQTVLDNFSAGGLYVRLQQRVEVGTNLLAVVRLISATDPTAPTPRVEVRGVVVRAEPHSDGQWGVGVRFTYHRFL